MKREDNIKHFGSIDTGTQNPAEAKVKPLENLLDQLGIEQQEIKSAIYSLNFHELDKLTVNGKPIFKSVKIDPDSGDLKDYTLSDEISAEIMGRFNELPEEVTGSLDSETVKYLELITEHRELMKNELYALQFAETTDAIKSVLDRTIKDATASDSLKVFKETFSDSFKLLEELEELEEDLKIELDKKEYEGNTWDSVIHSYTLGELTDLLKNPDSFFTKAINAVRNQNTAHEEGRTDRVRIKKTDLIELPLDKPNSYIWNSLETDTRGQLRLNFDMLPKNEGIQANAVYSINFDELGTDIKISRTLTPFDKRVYIAVSALFNAGNDIITLTQIYYAMGYTGKPAEKQIKRINEAVEKMRKSYITFDNEQEAEALGNYPHFKYQGYLLPIESLTATINGSVTESAIKMFREPPLMTFAKNRNQVTTITIKLLQSPINKTDANLAIDDYLLERISKEKHKNKKTCRLLFETIYKRTNITTKKQKQRAPEKIEKYLSFYKEQGFIESYSIQPDGVAIQLG